MNMNLRDVQYFAVVAQHRHLGRAAESLGLSQPALSMSLRRLERFMQTKLVKRTPKGVDLTASGEAVFAHARRLRLSVEDISREVADLSEGRAGHLRIGTGAGSALRLVPTACTTLLKESPKMTLKIVTSDRHAMLTSLGNGELDVVVTGIEAPRHEGLVEELLYDEQFVIYASANHRLAKRKQVSLADLKHERWVLLTVNGPPARQLSQALVDGGLPSPTVSVETASLPFRFHLVAESDMLAFGPRQAARYAATYFPIVELPVKDLIYNLRIGLFYRKDAYLSPAARRFIEILKATAKEIGKE